MKHFARFALLGCLLAAGCTPAPAEPEGGDAGAPADVATEAVPPTDIVVEPTMAEPTADMAAEPTTDAAAPMVAKVSANDATEEELVAAFEAAGIDNAEQWADEVVEYRPYSADDPDFMTLREELAKYNPAPGVVDQIIAVLEP